MNNETASEIEIRLAKYFNSRANIIVPNISWGLMPYECDLIVLRESGWAIEVEIKVSKSDLLADKNKKHTHDSNKIRELYFAIPEKLIPHIEHIPHNAGILVIQQRGIVHTLRQPTINESATKFTAEERYQLTRLGTMRIWALKEKLLNIIFETPSQRG